LLMIVASSCDWLQVFASDYKRLQGVARGSE
jgi:hypothetical protein